MKSKDELKQDFLELSAEGADIAISLLNESELLRDILKEFSKTYWEDRKFFYKKAYGLSGRDYGNLLSTKFVTITLDKSDKLRDIPSVIIHNVDFVITELGCLYAYISEDFENYFSFMDTSERSYPKNEGKTYIFDTPSSNEELSLKVK